MASTDNNSNDNLNNENPNDDKKNDDPVNSTIKTILPEPLTKLDPMKDFYFLDQMKNGIMISNQKINKNRFIVGRARDCDVIMDHPSISRYHAALLWAPKNDEQYQNGSNKESFWYLIDCGSTHGTICNKQPIEAGKLIKIIPNNNLFRFGASTRIFTLGSKETLSDSDEEEYESQVNTKNNQTKMVNNSVDSDVCTWGISMTDDIDENEENGDSQALKSIISAMKDGETSLRSENENAYSDNPYKCLQQWFEREGYDFDYKTDTVNNKFKCIFELPIDDQWIPVEGQLMNKKKEAIHDACLKCCRLLDQASLLFAWQKKDSAREKARKEYYEDDGDDLIDETISRKKFKKNDSGSVDNYETLNNKWKEINDELCRLKVKLATIGLEPGVQPEIDPNLADSLDVFYATMNQKKYGLSMNEKIEKSNLRMKIKHLEQEQTRIEKLIQIAKPIDIVLKTSSKTTKVIDSNKVNKIESIPTNPEPKETENLSKEPNIIDKEQQIKTEINENDTKPKPKSSKELKEIRKHRQQSIIEAIEKEKNLEKERQQQQQQQQESSIIENDTDFIDWIPLENQSGDGRTSLNEKFGY